MDEGIMGDGRLAAGVSRVAGRTGSVAALLVVVSALSGCIADGPSGSPLALNLAPAAKDSAPAAGEETKTANADLDKTSTASIAPTQRAARPRDVAIAAREAKAIRESGTISGSSSLDRLIEKHAKANNIPPELAYAVVRVESRYNPRARGAGVYGLSQIKLGTARSLGFSGPSSALYDADTNLTYGMRYLKGAWERGGHDVCRTAMKYQGGHRTTRMSASALRYCSSVKAQMAMISKARGATPDVAPEPEDKGLLATLVAAVAPTPSPAAAAAPAAEALTASEQPTAAAAAVSSLSKKEARAASASGEAKPAAPEHSAVVASAAKSTEDAPKVGRVAATTKVATATAKTLDEADDAALAARMSADEGDETGSGPAFAD